MADDGSLILAADGSLALLGDQSLAQVGDGGLTACCCKGGSGSETSGSSKRSSPCCFITALVTFNVLWHARIHDCGHDTLYTEDIAFTGSAAGLGGSSPPVRARVHSLVATLADGTDASLDVVTLSCVELDSPWRILLGWGGIGAKFCSDGGTSAAVSGITGIEGVWPDNVPIIITADDACSHGSGSVTFSVVDTDGLTQTFTVSVSW